MATPPPLTMCSQTVRARYTAGTIGTRPVPSYVDEPGVDPSRNTETYASLTFQVDRPPVGRRPVHPALGQGPGGGTRPGSSAPNEPPSPGNSRCARQRRGSPLTHT